jgi:hypothetical protein
LLSVLVAAAANVADGEQEDVMTKKSRRRTAGRKRSTADMATRKADQARGGAGAVAGILYAAIHNNDSTKPIDPARLKPGT